MFFKLLMPSVDRLMKGGLVGRWLKHVGDRVDYGDDLVEITVEIEMTTIAGDLQAKIRQIKDGGSLSDRKLEKRRVSVPMVLLVRVTSSDRGVLRRIEIPEGGYGEVGGLLAVLSDDENGVANPSSGDLNGASEFRVITNLYE